VVMERIRRRVLGTPEDLDSFGTAYTTYYVHEQVRYPRYVCNDCHRPGSWAWWPDFDPYYAHCSVVDFRVNWAWAWGPQIWTAYVPYYYYVVRPDCPPFYRTWATPGVRFSAWDGRSRWTDLWGGGLRRYKPVIAPVTYTPPPRPGTQWKGGGTPPGFIPPDVRRQGGVPGVRPMTWLQRDRGDGRPVWRGPTGTIDGPRLRPVDGGNILPRGGSLDPGTRVRSWRGWSPRGGSEPSAPAGGSGETMRDHSRPMWRPNEGGSSPAPQRQEAPRGEPVYRQAPPPSQAPRWSPPQGGKPEFRSGQGARPTGQKGGR